MKTALELKRRLEERLYEAVDDIRPQVLNPIEQQLGSEPNWKFIRSGLLNCLGERGLQGRIKDILDSELQGVEVSP